MSKKSCIFFSHMKGTQWIEVVSLIQYKIEVLIVLKRFHISAQLLLQDLPANV